jgi:endonuclease YncB( thermonuclease family)
LQQLAGAERIRLSHDGSVQLRFDAVDAPELHYGQAAQPLGADARDDLLARIGFTGVTYADGGSTTVTAADPAGGVRAAILSAMAEANGRPVSYVLIGDDEVLPADGVRLLADADLLGRTLNACLLYEGIAYYTAYTSTPAAHRDQLRELAAAARQKSVGVWDQDATCGFDLTDTSSIGPGGQLILPKLFRRCTDYLRAAAQGFAGDLAEWVIKVSTDPRHNENDSIIVSGATQVNLSDLLVQQGHRISFQADLLDITFVEKVGERFVMDPDKAMFIKGPQYLAYGVPGEAANAGERGCGHAV